MKISESNAIKIHIKCLFIQHKIILVHWKKMEEEKNSFAAQALGKAILNTCSLFKIEIIMHAKLLL